jgi:general secretion pathway protein E
MRTLRRVGFIDGRSADWRALQLPGWIVSNDGFASHLRSKGVGTDSSSFGANAKAGALLGNTHSDWLARTKLSAGAFADELARFYSCKRVQRADLAEARFAGAELSARFLREERLYPYVDREGKQALAIAAPIDDETLRAVEIALARKFAVAVATGDDIDFALTTQQGAASAAPAGAEFSEVSPAASEELDDLRDLARGAPVVRALDDLLRLAVDQRATDLHIEPFESALQVRLRVDGLLRAVTAPPIGMAKGLLSRLKIMAGLNITERRMPQDGRARISLGGSEIDLRVATMPTAHGESAVIRLLRKGGGVVSLEQLGLSVQDDKRLRSALQLPFGMIIVTGPTGSGKTTTLAASLIELNQPTRKILTIEDPIEYRIPGVNQTQVHPAIGLSFAAALRSFLRQDPDVIMVGEMRDAETAQMGVHSALTGHLVLTTLHTNTASGAITRLIDMGIESFLLSSCVKMIVGQRLVRMLCEDCKTSRPLTEADLVRDERYALSGFRATEMICEPKGCEWCGFTGFRGRRGVFETLEISPEIRSLIGPRCDGEEIERVARGEGMITMIEDGVAKCRAGLTTIEEVYRVTMSV